MDHVTILVRSLRRDPGHNVSNTWALTNGSLVRFSFGEPFTLNELQPANG
jgi:hypothetical protein